MASKYSGPEPVAIIGSACRLPGGASSPSKLWDLLKNPRDLLRDIPPSRFNAEAFYHEDPEHHGVSQQFFSSLIHSYHDRFEVPWDVGRETR